MADRDLAGRALFLPMQPRATDESHRAATPLELFFDLVFVVAIAGAAEGLHHSIIEGHAADGLIGYVMVFFAIWWAWVGFTWFASAYDTDDVPYRLLVLVQLTGALVLAAGVSSAFTNQDWRLGAVGYVIMRLVTVIQWLRVARDDPPRRPNAMRIVPGLIAVQAGWVALVLGPKALLLPGFFVLVLLELLLPIWAERAAPTTWHRQHIAERYGLLTIIVLGESILAASLALQSATEAGELSMALAPIVIGGLLTVFSLWWLYFDREGHELLTSMRRAFVWGYGHYLIFASGAAVGAGIAVAVDHATHHGEISDITAGAAVAIPVAIFLTCLTALHGRDTDEPSLIALLSPLAIVSILLTPFTGQPVLMTGLILVALITLKTLMRHREASERGS